jgi:hypothetical protein
MQAAARIIDQGAAMATKAPAPAAAKPMLATEIWLGVIEVEASQAAAPRAH